MSHIMKLRRLYALKSIYREAPVHDQAGKRHESAAEHVWSCLMLADYFLTLMDELERGPKLDREHVYELIMYHDIVEIEAGDTPIHAQSAHDNHITNQEKRKEKQGKEMKAMASLAKQFPPSVGKKLISLFTEFEERKTAEARFAKAMDVMDATMHELDYPWHWKGWNEALVRSQYGKAAAEFEIVNDAFEECLAHVRENKFYQ